MSPTDKMLPSMSTRHLRSRLNQTVQRLNDQSTLESSFSGNASQFLPANQSAQSISVVVQRFEGTQYQLENRLGAVAACDAFQQEWNALNASVIRELMGKIDQMNELIEKYCGFDPNVTSDVVENQSQVLQAICYVPQGLDEEHKSDKCKLHREELNPFVKGPDDHGNKHNLEQKATKRSEVDEHEQLNNFSKRLRPGSRQRAKEVVHALEELSDMESSKPSSARQNHVKNKQRKAIEHQASNVTSKVLENRSHVLQSTCYVPQGLDEERKSDYQNREELNLFVKGPDDHRNKNNLKQKATKRSEVDEHEPLNNFSKRLRSGSRLRAKEVVHALEELSDMESSKPLSARLNHVKNKQRKAIEHQASKHHASVIKTKQLATSLSTSKYDWRNTRSIANVSQAVPSKCSASCEETSMEPVNHPDALKYVSKNKVKKARKPAVLQIPVTNKCIGVSATRKATKPQDLILQEKTAVARVKNPKKRKPQRTRTNISYECNLMESSVILTDLNSRPRRTVKTPGNFWSSQCYE